MDEAVTTVLSHSAYKDCFEAIKLLAKVKTLQFKRYEALVLYKRLVEINPMDYQASFEVAQLFESIDQPIALKYYQQGIEAYLRLRKRSKEGEFSEKSTEDLLMDLPAEILNNLAVL